MATEVSFAVNGEVVATLVGAAEILDEQVNRILDDTSALLLTQIKRNASGRPGPNAPTGDYRRSWTRRKIKDGYNVGTNRPQARRLEMGFYGRDSLGRMYQQQPYPHVDPAVDAITPSYLAAMESLAALITDGKVSGVNVSFKGLMT